MVRKMKRAVSRRSDQVVVGIDPSLTGTGIAMLENGEVADYRGCTTTKTVAKRNPDHVVWFDIPEKSDDRFRLLRVMVVAEWVCRTIEIMLDGRSAHVAIEGYALNSRSNRASDLHELGGLIKSMLAAAGIPIRVYTPSVAKMAVTGRGTADKGDMKIAAYKAYGLELVDLGDAGENIADALMLASLLNAELAVRNGLVKPSDLSASVRRALLYTTKKEPEAIVSRPFLTFEGDTLQALSKVLR